jgi:hypothetical protein
MNPPLRQEVAAEEANAPGGTALVTTMVARGHSTLTFECTDGVASRAHPMRLPRREEAVNEGDAVGPQEAGCS